MMADALMKREAEAGSEMDDQSTASPMDGVIRFLERARTVKAKKELRAVEKDQDPGPEAA